MSCACVCACVYVSVCLSATTNVVFICGVNCLFHRSIHRCANKFTDALNTSHLNEHTALHSAFDAIVLNNFVVQNVNQIHNIIITICIHLETLATVDHLLSSQDCSVHNQIHFATASKSFLSSQFLLLP